MSQIAVSIQNVVKTYRIKKQSEGFFSLFRDTINPCYVKQQALDDVSFEIAKGQCLGYLGPNGAGKSTLIKLLCGLLQPNSGKVEVLGYQPFRKERDFLYKIGVVFGHKSSLWWDLPVIESFQSSRIMYDISLTRFHANLERMSNAFDLKNILHKPARVLSLGERVKSEVAMNLLHDPKILFLDEPTVGLDVKSKAELRSYIKKETKKQGLTVFMASHDMGDIEACCDQVIITNRGRIEHTGDLETVKRSLREGYSKEFSQNQTDDDSQTLEDLIVSYFRKSETSS